MTTLLIKDLAIAADLDHSAMSAVRGGSSGYKMPSYSYCGPKYPAPCWPGQEASPSKVSLDVSQQIGQCQSVENNNGNNVAFANCISSTVNPTQTANNSISF
ncbi:hypothetical protein EGT07_12690 [Herbaspirillum sp. HC18]|nr:hypothetical protein EGT07_12690 [Herbaspirillum sp. HC18]